MVKKYGYDYSETLRDSKISKKIFLVMTKKDKKRKNSLYNNIPSNAPLFVFGYLYFL